jgi:hypothetical protein
MSPLCHTNATPRGTTHRPFLAALSPLALTSLGGHLGCGLRRDGQAVNEDVAVFTRLNDLAQRHGLKPYDFVASFKPEEDRQGSVTHVLAFEVPASGNALREERFDKMLATLGVGPDSGELRGDTATIIDALDNALEHAPRSRRF